MASTILAVDDSVTMRKVLEITFAGQEFRVVAVNSADAALQKFKAEKPDIVVSDITLEGKTGYDLCKSIKGLSATTPVLLLSSKQNPYDAAKGSASQADDHIDKPFDTQQMIDKVKKMLSGQPTAAKPAAAAAPAPAPAPAPVAAAAAPARAPVGVDAQPAAKATTPAMQAVGSPGGPPSPQIQRAKTLIYNPPQGAPGGPALAPAPAAVSRNAPTPVTGVPLKQPAAAPEPAVAAFAASPAVAHANGQMAGKLEGMGLTPAQVEGVLALSRELVERVVWEVVPVLAETIIKEELARLTK